MQLTRRGAARLASVAVLSTFALAGCNHPGAGDPGTNLLPASGVGTGSVASVTTPKGTTLSITQPEFYAQLQNYIPNSPPQNFAPMSQPAGRLVLQQLLMNLMVEGMAQDQGLAPTDAEITGQYNNIKMLQDARNVKGFDQALTDAGLTADIFKELQVKPQLSQLKLLTKGITVSDADVQTFYNTNKDKQFTKPSRVHIKRIVVATLPEAQAIAKAIAGGQTFESQVSKSLDKSTADGDVPNWVPLDPAPPGLAAVIKPISATAAGQVTPPITVPGQNGQSTYWLVKVVEKKPKETLPLDQIKDLIRANLLQQKAGANPAAQQALQQQLRDFQTQAKVSITGAQYASLVQELTHPAPPAPPAGGPGGGLPFAPAPAPAGKP